MRPVLKSALTLLWREPGTLQLRLDPEHAVVLRGLQPAEAAVLAALDGSLDTGQLDRVAEQAGLVPHRLSRLLALLAGAGVLDDAGGAPSPLASWPHTVRARLAPDRAALGLLHARRTDGGDGLVAARAARWVQVVGAGRVGTGVARLLSAAGLGRVTVEDLTPASLADVSPLGISVELRGMARGRAAELLAAADSPLGELPAPQHPPTRPDLVVLAPDRHPDLQVVEALLREGTPHLAVHVRETAVIVGPLVLPGMTACLRCLDLHRCDRDGDWSAVAAQLHGERAEVLACDTVLAALGAAAAAASVLAHLDGGPPGPTHNGTVEFALPFGLPRRRSWVPHPLCGCRWDLE